MTRTYLITGASRGLGYEFVFQLLSVPNNYVIATVRNKETALDLNKLAEKYVGSISIITMNVSNLESIRSGAREVEQLLAGKDGLDCLIANAGVLAGGWACAVEGSVVDLHTNLQTNLFGVVSVSQELLPLLRRGVGKQLIVISSLSGSIGGRLSDTGFAATYSVSKAAVNMWVKKLGAELASEGFTVLPVHPGYVKTQMNGGREGSGEIFQEESVEKMLKIITSVTPADNGKFFDYTGEILPW